MYIQRNTKKVNDKIYSCVLLRHNYRENGKVKHKTILNLSNWSKELVEQFELLLKGGKVTTPQSLKYKQGKSYGAIKVIYEISKRLGIAKALGHTPEAKLCLLMIMGRILNNCSILSLCNWGLDQAIEEVLKISKFDDDDLYAAMTWLSEKQTTIEKKIFKEQKGKNTDEYYLDGVKLTFFEDKMCKFSDCAYNKEKGKEFMTSGNAFICMLSYIITKYICDSLIDLNIQKEFIFQTLDRISYTIYNFNDKEIKVLPNEYSELQNKILNKLNIKFQNQL